MPQLCPLLCAARQGTGTHSPKATPAPAVPPGTMRVNQLESQHLGVPGGPQRLLMSSQGTQL